MNNVRQSDHNHNLLSGPVGHRIVHESCTKDPSLELFILLAVIRRVRIIQHHELWHFDCEVSQTRCGRSVVCASGQCTFMFWLQKQKSVSKTLSIHSDQVKNSVRTQEHSARHDKSQKK